MALRVPVAVGLKLTLKVVLAPGARVVLESPETVKSELLAPFLESARPVRLALPRLRMVKVWAEAEVPTLVEAKFTLELPSARLLPFARWMAISGDVTMGAEVPVPRSETSKGFSLASLLATRSVALREPVPVGLKLTLKVVFSPGARVVLESPEVVKSEP